MIILAIDTSCDDTCVALLKTELPMEATRRDKSLLHPSLRLGQLKKRTKSSSPIKNWRAKRGFSSSPLLLSAEARKLKILSNIVSSQAKLHAKYGGVYPSLAKREHQKNLPLVFRKALKEAKLALSDSRRVDLIGVTIGPGLEPCLWQGVNFAKELAERLKKPLVSVNHIEAHILANFINKEIKNWSPPARHLLKIKNYFPAICLVVSGGHTQLTLMRDIGKYELVGETRDDAAGECFDKAARILGLGYPGGPAIAAEAARCKIKDLRFKIYLPRPMIYQKNYDFSFSGLKTAVLYDFRSRSSKIRESKKYIRAMCAEIQQAIIDVLIHKTLKAAKNFKAKSVILGGGVTANNELRKQFQEKVKKELPNIQYLTPNIKFCTDNAAMVAATAFFHRKLEKAAFAKASASQSWQKIKVNANLKIGDEVYPLRGLPSS